MTAAPQEAPLNESQLRQLESLVGEMDDHQLHWLQGYLAGYAVGRKPGGASTQAPTASDATPLTVLFGSQTGNAESLAEALTERAREKQLQVRCYDMAEYPVRQLKKETRLAIITSTHGEGDPPDNALELHEFLAGRKAPKLTDIRYAVLALGDSSYEYFCQTGKDFDERLKALGATPLLERVDSDVDYDDTAEAWIDRLLEKLSQESAPQQPMGTSGISPLGGARTGAKAEPQAARYDRKNPYPAELLDRVCLNGRGSSKQVYHAELSLEDSGLHYEPGDSVGVYVQNDERLVDKLITSLSLSGTEAVDIAGESHSLRDAFTHQLELTRLTRPTVDRWAQLSESRELIERVKDHRGLMGWMRGRDLLDLIQDYPIKGLDAQTLVSQVRKLPPRLYSIASSQAAVEDEVHLTVAAVRYQAHGREREGVASTWLADRLAEDAQAPVFIDTNKNFKLPENPDAPIIMVGPGTGIAPFRAFMQEREIQAQGGKNWLFFGDRNFQTDFLYQSEWLQWRKRGLLNRIDVAFSRDRERKIYVQQRIREAAKELWAWLEDGAYFYVCGDATAMAPDVNEALLDVIMHQGDLTRERAEEYLRDLTKSKRYQRDVY